MTGTARTVAILAVTAFVLLWTAAASAQRNNCLPREQTTTQLAGEFDERMASQGLVQGGKAIIEVFVSKSGSWTVLATDIDPAPARGRQPLKRRQNYHPSPATLKERRNSVMSIFSIHTPETAPPGRRERPRR